MICLAYILMSDLDTIEAGYFFWIIQAIFTLFIFVADFIANGYFLKKYGSSKWGERVGMISIIVGSFFFPPFGLIIIPFLFVFITELMHKSAKRRFSSRSCYCSYFFWIIQAIFTLFIFVADFIANGYFLKKYGSSKWGERVGMISIIVGSFFFPPFGLIIIPFLSVFITELMHKSAKRRFSSRSCYCSWF